MNRVCAVHNEYCPDGDCRWCVAPAAEPDEAAPVMDFTYGFAMHQPAAAPSIFGIADVDRLGRIVGERVTVQPTYVCGRCGRDTYHREIDTCRGYCYQDPECRAIAARRTADNMSKNRELLARLKAAEQWPPGGVTGSGL